AACASAIRRPTIPSSAPPPLVPPNDNSMATAVSTIASMTPSRGKSFSPGLDFSMAPLCVHRFAGVQELLVAEQLQQAEPRPQIHASPVTAFQIALAAAHRRRQLLG